MPRLKSANFAVTTLQSGITNSATSFTVADASSFPDEGRFIILVHDMTPGFAGVKEIMEVGAINKGTNTFSSVLRGREGTSGVAHSAGARVECIFSAGSHQELAGASDLLAHIGDDDNPHEVTAAQVGAETPAGTQAKVDAHADDVATINTLGHVKVDGETITASNGIISAQTQIVDTVTSDKWKWGMEDGIVFLEKVVV